MSLSLHGLFIKVAFILSLLQLLCIQIRY